MRLKKFKKLLKFALFKGTSEDENLNELRKFLVDLAQLYIQFIIFNEN